MLHLVRTGTPSTHAVHLYEESFPCCERRTLAHHEKLAVEQDSFFAGELFTTNETFVGILYFWHWPQHHLLFVEHLAIKPQLRGLGFGHRALQLVQKPQTCVILEIEPVTDAVTARRLSFYTSAGFCRLPQRHVQLPYHPGGECIPLELLSWQDSGTPASSSQVLLLEHLLHTRVMLPVRC